MCQSVKLGLRGESRTEILEGVAVGEALIAAANLHLQPGSRVRIAPASAGAQAPVPGR